MSRKVKLEMSMRIGKKRTNIKADTKSISTDELIAFEMGLTDLIRHRLMIENMDKLTKEILEGK